MFTGAPLHDVVIGEMLLVVPQRHRTYVVKCRLQILDVDGTYRLVNLRTDTGVIPDRNLGRGGRF